MSLKDQLLKAGLIDAKKAKAATAQIQKQQHQLKKGQQLQAEQLGHQADLAQWQAQQEAKRQADTERNKERDRLTTQRENFYRALQTLNSKAQNTHQARTPYYFAQGQTIKRVLVTPYQQEQLARGFLGISQPHAQEEEFLLVPRDTAVLVGNLVKDMLVLLHPEVAPGIDLEDLG